MTASTWPVGSLQWALDTAAAAYVSTVRRRSVLLELRVTGPADLQLLDTGTRMHYEAQIDDLAALDWEVAS